ncbi:glucosaminidase domain-containing protein [Clostridium sp.]|uniref:glycoside hydrolase family 73 protein n=1 Tax=Clostridium sp. TaxID=1506 RepID=UPI0026137867|nr:glucosaminidase domain-containing protein [Clostridium sp.]
MVGGTYNGVENYKRKVNRTKIRGLFSILLITLLTISSLIIISIFNKNVNKDVDVNNSFIELIKDKAVKNYKDYGILPSVTISQAIIESDWGNSTLASEYNNLFGIKADESWKGDKVNFETNENYDDIIHSNFRSYKSIEDSVEDHGKFLFENSRYRESGLFDSNDYKIQAKALENAGYATVKDEKGELIYSKIIIEVIESNNLYAYDK